MSLRDTSPPATGCVYTGPVVHVDRSHIAQVPTDGALLWGGGETKKPDMVVVDEGKKWPDYLSYSDSADAQWVVKEALIAGDTAFAALTPYANDGDFVAAYLAARAMTERNRSTDVTQFRDESFWLSNMMPARVTFNHPQKEFIGGDQPHQWYVYSSVEHAFHALKVDFAAARKRDSDGGDVTFDNTLEAWEEFVRVAGAKDAKEAKKRGRKVPPHLFNPADWDNEAYPGGPTRAENAMRLALESKFQIPVLAALLMATGDRKLIEGNSFGDTQWGVVLPETLSESKRASVPLFKEYGNGSLVGKNVLGEMLEEMRTMLMIM